MYIQGTKLRVVLPINLNGSVFHKGLTGEIQGSVNKMVGKSYRIAFDDGRIADIHVVILNNQIEVIKN